MSLYRPHKITFEDWNWLNGFMAIDIYLNECLIKYQEKAFLECKDTILKMK